MSKAPRKPKPYTGLVQFDVWGNLAEWERADKEYLTDDNFQNGQILLDTWDHSQGGYIKKPVFFTPQELELEIYPTPGLANVPHWHKSHGKVTIGQINMFVNKPNFEFTDTLEYHDYGSSQYSKYFIMKSLTTGANYRVFIKHLKSFIDIMDKGVCTGTFTFCKNGQKYGLKPV